MPRIGNAMPCHAKSFIIGWRWNIHLVVTQFSWQMRLCGAAWFIAFFFFGRVSFASSSTTTPHSSPIIANHANCELSRLGVCVWVLVWVCLLVCSSGLWTDLRTMGLSPHCLSSYPLTKDPIHLFIYQSISQRSE
jgi:hypothetical protein